MSAEEGEDVSPRDFDRDGDGVDTGMRPRRRTIKQKAETAAEWPWTKISARLSMILVAPLLLVVAWFGERTLQQIDTRIDHVAEEQKDQGDQLEQIAINQAQGKIERDDQAKSIDEIKQSIVRLWDLITKKR